MIFKLQLIFVCFMYTTRVLSLTKSLNISSVYAPLISNVGRPSCEDLGFRPSSSSVADLLPWRRLGTEFCFYEVLSAARFPAKPYRSVNKI